MIYYFMGIDGSGKSSLLEEIENRLRLDNIQTLNIWARYSPRLIKPFVGIFRKRTIPDSKDYHDISDKEYSVWQSSKRKITRSGFVRRMLLMIFFVDYYLQLQGVFKKIRKNKDKIVFLDRFVIDFLVDQTINFGDISGTWIYRRLIRMCNKLDSVFLISVDPDTALNRKNDIPGYNYLNERDIIYKNIFKELSNGHIINNNGSPEVAVNEIIKYIIY